MVSNLGFFFHVVIVFIVTSSFVGIELTQSFLHLLPQVFSLLGVLLIVGILQVLDIGFLEFFTTEISLPGSIFLDFHDVPALLFNLNKAVLVR